MTHPAQPTAACPDAETLAALAEGRLSRHESAALIAHIDGCDDCLAALEAVNETIATRKVVPFARRHAWWLAAAAAAAAIAVVSLVVPRLPFGQRPAAARLIPLMPRSARPVEPRLTGGFPWAPYKGPMRAEDESADAQRMRLIGSAGDIVADADRDRSPDAEHAAGVALVVIEKPANAIDRLRDAVQKSPNDASAWSDLAAAQYAAALDLSRMSLLPEALDSADRALRIDPRRAEALFNRALILERLGLGREAGAAWGRYLDVDASSPWAVEARARLAKLRSTPASTQTDAQRLRTFAEAETLGRWAEATQRGETDAERELSGARSAADTLAQTTGETLLREAVGAIDRATPAGRVTLAGAHVLYRRGRIAYSKRQLDAALADLTGAAHLFENAGSPMSLVARYYTACVRFDRNDVAEARGALQSLLGEAEAHPGFIALGAEVRWELALAFMVDSDWSGALPLLEQSRDAFRRLGERNHLGFVESLLADTLLSLGRPDEAWAARAAAFTLLSVDGAGDRLPVSLKAAAQMEARAGRLMTARAILDVARETQPTIASDAIAADLLIHIALVDVALGDHDGAALALREATTATQRIREPNTRALAQTHLELAGAATILNGQPARARELLSRAIDGYRASGRIVFLPECFLLRARASLRGGDEKAATEDLDAGIATLARSQIRTGSIVGTGVLDAGHALFDEAIRLSADRGDVDGAFEYAERSRAQLATPVTVRELQDHLGSTGAAVLRIVPLPQELIAICVTAHDKRMERRPFPRAAAERLANGSDDVRSLAQLYDLLVRPFEPMIASSRALIVIADRPLQNVPFAALYDSTAHRYLVERIAVSTAISASALRRLQRVPPHSLLAVTLPSGRSNAGLPDSVREADEVAPLYASAVRIAPDRATTAAFAGAATAADVIHVAGHTKRESDDTGIALTFADERLTWSAIAARPLPRSPIIVLAACETLRQRGTANTRSMTLGDGFLAAGASDVVGTLTPIADADARELFQSIHRHLAAGQDAPEAVRAAQIEAIARHTRSWQAVASLTRCIPTT